MVDIDEVDALFYFEMHQYLIQLCTAAAVYIITHLID